jgi:hypothetical protein
MSSLFKYVICSAVVLLMAGTVVGATPPGFLEGSLKISSPKEVELADATPSKRIGENFIDYPLIVLSRDGKRQIARVTPDANGNYRVTLPPGDYILDVSGRRPKGHLRATPQPFTVASNQTVHVDMNIDTGVR